MSSQDPLHQKCQYLLESLYIVKILNCKRITVNPLPILGLQERSKVQHRNIILKKMIKNLYKKNFMYNVTKLQITMQEMSESVNSKLLKQWHLDQYWNPEKCSKFSQGNLLLKKYKHANSCRKCWIKFLKLWPPLVNP